VGSPRGRRLRRAQASAITVAILTSAVLALGLALYAYFTGHASRAYEAEALTSIYGDYATSISVHVDASYINTSTPVETACYMVTLTNRAGGPRIVYLTVLPARRGLNLPVILEPEVRYVPYDYSYTPPRLRVLLFYAKDVNGDGVVDVVGRNSYVVPGNPWLPTCDEIYSYPYTTKLNITLPYEDVDASKVEAGLSGLSLSKLASNLGVNLAYIPLWRVELPTGGTATLFIYVELPQTPQSLSLAMLFPFTGKYYIALLANLPLSTS